MRAFNILCINEYLKKWGVCSNMHMCVTYDTYNIYKHIILLQLKTLTIRFNCIESVFVVLPLQHTHLFSAGKELWAVVSSALALARQNPTPFVSAVRIVEREEALDQALLEERGGSSRPLPPGRPRCWRACFFTCKCYQNMK